ncbi:uncharacterized protein LOC124163254 [Ischnura elegans]|uniref:uncharacterized protein LOC124163254 n=1 Tax=Ischnura elegans TaxID=197161 RepID=UPI001ED89E40|nr:uncharacterized protein LOC124163254 [Ischnura elegans]
MGRPLAAWVLREHFSQPSEMEWMMRGVLLLLCLSAQGLWAAEDAPQGDDVDNLLKKEGDSSPAKKALPLYEEDQRFPPIVSRNSWDDKKHDMYTTLPVDYIVVRDGGKRCKSHIECVTLLASEIRKSSSGDTTTVDNFYIGGNGEVYEGRGWAVQSYWHLNGLRRKAVTVKFLGSHESDGPSERVMRAFWRMAKSGIWQKKLSPDFHVVSMGVVYNDSSLVGHGLEKVIQDSSRAVNEFNMMATWAFSPESTFPLISREEWGAKQPMKQAKEMEFRIKYIMINEGGERCFTHEECMSRVKAEQEKQLNVYGDLVDNFYIGEDGYVYEGRGFNRKPLWDTELEDAKDRFFKEDAMTVRLFGNFQSDLPSEKAIGALKLLVNAGLWLHRINDNYHIYSFRGIYHDSRFLGDKLFEVAKKWIPWATQLDDRIAKSIESGDGFIGMVKRATWGAKDATKEMQKMSHPVDFVIIEEHGEQERCVDSEKCTEIMKEIQNSEMAGYGDLKDNFYVSDNGNVYEGRGWGVEPHFQPKYFNKSLITVNFLGDHKEDGASLTAVAAFENLIKVGVKLGKVSANYHLYSSRDVYDDPALLGDSLRKYFVTKDEWSKDLDSLSEAERYDKGLLPIVRHREWSENKPHTPHHQFTKPVHYVVVSSMGERCHSNDDCVNVLKEAEKNKKAQKEGLMDNFYIGEDGMAYEGRGWDFAPSFYHEGLKHEFYRVTVLGQFEDEAHPYDLAMSAFSTLMKSGLKMGKLAPDYKVVSIHQVLKSGTGSKDNLYSKLKADERYSSDFDLLADHKIFVPREDWHAAEPARTTDIPNHPVGYVIATTAGEDCTDLVSCTQVVQKMQKNLPPRYWDVADNFYIGGDGHIVEGRGWDHSSHWAVKGIENNFISVGFLGAFESTTITPKALLAFHVLLQTGVALGKLSYDFKTVSMAGIVPNQGTEKFIEALKTTDDWSDTFELKYDAARVRSINTSLVLTDEWNHSDLSIRQSSKLTHPLKYVVIRDGGSPCDTFEACMAAIQREHKDTHDEGNGGVAENFYIGNEGSVMEGTGWDWDMRWGFNGWQQAIEVQFFGSYEDELPSKAAFDALYDVLIKIGIETGKLDADYRILSTPTGDTRTLGKKFKEEILTWNNSVVEIP